MTLSGTVPDKVCKRRKKGRSVGLVRLDGTFFCMLRPLFQFFPPVVPVIISSYNSHAFFTWRLCGCNTLPLLLLRQFKNT